MSFREWVVVGIVDLFQGPKLKPPHKTHSEAGVVTFRARGPPAPD